MRVCALFLLTLSIVGSYGKTVVQPIVDYSVSLRENHDSTPPINSFVSFTHFASDFGWMGPGQDRIYSADGMIGINTGKAWTGAWHSLAGLALNKSRILDPLNTLDLGAGDLDTSIISGVGIRASGTGTVRVEISNADRELVWTYAFELNPTLSDLTAPLAASQIGDIKFINWVVEAGTVAGIRSLSFQMEVPDIPLEEWAFRISLGKLRRCHDADSGLTRDRGHLPAGEFDSIPSTGFHALGSSLGVKEGFLDRERVILEIQTTLNTLEQLPKAYGFLPHFVQLDADSGFIIQPGTEYSTVDTAIAFHCLLLATEILGLDREKTQVLQLIEKLDFDAVIDADGYVVHGFQENGVTPLRSSWKDWGGESALMLVLEGMVPDRSPKARMDKTGEVFRGVGFISEIQSLFYPDFDSQKPDRTTGIVWPEVRDNLLRDQKNYFERYKPQSFAAQNGLFGLSAGEAGFPGDGYSANGVDVADLSVIHPHYFLMAIALSDPGNYSDQLHILEKAGLLLHTGLPEVIDANLDWKNPMQGSLNAGFETIAAYHGLKTMSGSNEIHEASLRSPLLRKAIVRFY